MAVRLALRLQLPQPRPQPRSISTQLENLEVSAPPITSHFSTSLIVLRHESEKHHRTAWSLGLRHPESGFAPRAILFVRHAKGQTRPLQQALDCTSHSAQNSKQLKSVLVSPVKCSPLSTAAKFSQYFAASLPCCLVLDAFSPSLAHMWSCRAQSSQH